MTSMPPVRDASPMRVTTFVVPMSIATTTVGADCAPIGAQNAKGEMRLPRRDEVPTLSVRSRGRPLSRGRTGPRRHERRFVGEPADDDEGVDTERDRGANDPSREASRAE